jgi:hypothetical protein
MLNVHELERRWLRYRIRRYVPVGIAAVSVIALLSVSIYVWPLLNTAESETFSASVAEVPQPTTPKTESSTPAAEPEKTVAHASPAAVPAATVKRPEPAAAAPSKTVLSPSMSFMNRLEASSTAPKVEKSVPPKKPETAKKTAAEKNVVRTAPAEQTTVKKPKATVQPQPGSLSITQEEANDLNDVVKRFETNKSPALSLFLARRYYDLEQYDLSYEYALRTNEIDSSIEESWLLFARSLVKLGRKDEALKTLGSYARHSNSARAKMLLDEIREGTFK